MSKKGKNMKSAQRNKGMTHMQNGIRTSRVGRGFLKACVTASAMGGAAYGSYHVKNWVTDATDNAIFGYAAGVATLLVGAAVTTKINSGIDKAFEVKPLPTPTQLFPTDPHMLGAPNKFDFGLDLDDEDDEECDEL